MKKEQLNLFTADKQIMLVEAMQKIDQNSRGVLFVTNEEGKLCGAVSDGDIRRWILKTGKLDVKIEALMNKAPQFLNVNDSKTAYKYMQESGINVIPIVDEQNYIQNILFRDNNKKICVENKEILKSVPVIIMAGGKGTRLYPYTKILPKPLIPIGDIPIVERIIHSFYECGVNDFYMTVNYRKNMILSYFSEIEKGYALNYVEEDVPLGTAGSIRLIQTSFSCPLFVTNCDILIRADYSDIYTYHQKSGNTMTIVTALKSDIIPYGVVSTKDNGELKSIEEKPCRSYFVNTGMYIINPELISLIPPNLIFHMTELADKAMREGFKIGTYPISEDSFLDMGEFEEMKRMEEKLNLTN